MDYKNQLGIKLTQYNEMKAQYEELISTDTYHTIVSFMPFELLSVKQTLETLDLFDKLETKPKIVFHSVEEAEVLYNNLRNFTKNSEQLLNCAAYIERVDSLINEINSFVDSTAYLSKSLKINNDIYLSQIAKDCLTNIPNGKNLITFDFKYNFIESCLFSLSKDDLQRLVSKKMISSKDIDHIALTGNEKYMENLQYLCFLTDHSILKEAVYDTKLKGVKFSNPDGSLRQDVLKELDEAQKNGEKIELTTRKYVYQPPQGVSEPAIAVDWNGKCLGNLPAPIAKEIEEKYTNASLSADFIKIVGGGDLTYGMEISLNVIASELNLPKLKEKLKDLEAKLPEYEKGSFSEAEKNILQEQIDTIKRELNSALEMEK